VDINTLRRTLQKIEQMLSLFAFRHWSAMVHPAMTEAIGSLGWRM
jgi:hypothetical protein